MDTVPKETVRMSASQHQPQQQKLHHCRHRMECTAMAAFRTFLDMACALVAGYRSRAWDHGLQLSICDAPVQMGGEIQYRSYTVFPLGPG